MLVFRCDRCGLEGSRMTASGLVGFERLIMGRGVSYELGYDSSHKLGVLSVGQLPSPTPGIHSIT